MENSNKTKIIVVAGPTASGKTSLGIEIAKALDGEIICADSMQVYKDMEIATAAPTPEEKKEVPHHLTDFLERNENFNVSNFCDIAGEKIKEISERGKVPIIVGGTGLFIDSLVDNIKFVPTKADLELRNKLESKSEDELYEELSALDFEAAKKIHKNNKSRVIRALEIYYSSGKTKTEQNVLSRLEESPYDTLYFVISYKEREKLYNRINKRVDLMIEKGLVEEAKKCLKTTSGTAAQAIGHKELAPFLNGEITLEEATNNLKKETRHYAKRQITWFKRRSGAEFIFADDNNETELKSSVILKCKEFLNV